MSSLLRIASLGLIGAAASSVMAQGVIKSVEVKPLDQGVEVIVQGVGLEKPREIRLLQGQSYIVEFDASLEARGFRRRIDRGGVSSVEVGWFSAKPPKARVHLRVNPSLQPVLSELDGGYTIKVGPGVKSEPGTVIPPTNPTGKQDEFPKATPPIGSSTLPPVLISQAKPETKPTPALKPDEAAAKPTLSSAASKQETKPAPAAKPDGTLPKPAPAAAPKPDPKPAEVKPAPERRVNLEFVGADVVMILRALSQEAGVNIVTAPDVSPSDKPSRLTVSLKNETVSNALNYVTVMSGLRYAKLGNTFFVTKAENFASTMRSFYRGDSSNFETRVVNLLSGEAGQIRNAVLASHSQEGASGFYDILDPAGAGPVPTSSEEKKAQPPVVPGQNSGAADLNFGRSADEVRPAGPAKAAYLMVVGEPKRVEQISRAIMELDTKITRSFSVGRNDDTGAVAMPILSGQTKQIKEMLEKLLVMNPRKGDFTFSESTLRELSEGDLNTNVLLMIGPKADLETLKAYAQTLDENLCRTAGIAYTTDSNGLERIYDVVDLKYIEPAIAAFDLKNRIRGLYVTVLPDPVTPSATGIGTRKDEKQEATRAADQQGGDKPTEAAKKEELEKIVGREPMKLVLRGTRQQIEEAKSYLALVDLAPKQVAFEMRILDLSKEDALRLGFDWSLITGGRVQTLSNFISNTDGVSDQVTGSVGAANFIATLDKADMRRNLIARPNALLSDGRGHTVFVGDTIRYVESIQATQNGITITTASLDVGVTMGMVAKIGNGGAIALDLATEFTLLNGFTPVPGGGQLPQTSERRANTFVNMKAGEVIVIGGLIQDSDRKRIAGIPILKDLPIIGSLFSRTEKSKVRTEVVFVLAAVEVTDGNRKDAASPRKSEMGTPDPRTEYLKTGSNSKP